MKKEWQIIDVWMQHPNLEFINHPMFESLRRWMGIEKVTERIPIEYLPGWEQGESRQSCHTICASHVRRWLGTLSIHSQIIHSFQLLA